MKKASILAGILFTFMKIGAFTFGGGYAMISMIYKDCVDRKKWITHDELSNIIAITEAIPGPIVIKCATYVGYERAGFPGSLLAAIGFVLPSFVIIFLISQFFDSMLEIAVIANAFKGIKIAVGVLIFSVGINMLSKMQKDKLSTSIIACSLLISLLNNFFSLGFSNIYLILIAGLTGYLTFIIEQIKGRDHK